MQTQTTKRNRSFSKSKPLFSKKIAYLEEVDYKMEEMTDQISEKKIVPCSTSSHPIGEKNAFEKKRRRG